MTYSLITHNEITQHESYFSARGASRYCTDDWIIVREDWMILAAGVEGIKGPYARSLDAHNKAFGSALKSSPPAQPRDPKCSAGGLHQWKSAPASDPIVSCSREYRCRRCNCRGYSQGNGFVLRIRARLCRDCRQPASLAVLVGSRHVALCPACHAEGGA